MIPECRGNYPSNYGLREERDAVMTYKKEQKEHPHKEEKEGLKYDEDKLRYDLILPEMKQWIAEILTHGAKKYGSNNWQKVELHRYLAAMDRHLVKWQLGEEIDPDSGYNHLKHFLANALFITWLGINRRKKDVS